MQPGLEEVRSVDMRVCSSCRQLRGELASRPAPGERRLNSTDSSSARHSVAGILMKLMLTEPLYKPGWLWGRAITVLLQRRCPTFLATDLSYFPWSLLVTLQYCPYLHFKFRVAGISCAGLLRRCTLCGLSWSSASRPSRAARRASYDILDLRTQCPRIFNGRLSHV